MVEQLKQSISDLADWQADVLRLTVFPGPKPFATENNWWEELVGEPPEARTTQPREGVVREEGKAFGAKLTLVVQAPRIDWLFTAIEPPLVIGTLSETLPSFSTKMNEWLAKDSPPAQRLAFGVVLELPVADKIAGYRKLSTYLPDLKVDAEGTSDLLYQINRPRPSTTDIEGVKINRLAKWTVGLMQRATLSLVQDQAPALEEARFHCRLELDISTSSEFRGELSNQQQLMLFTELLDLGLEIARKGDIA